MKKIIGITLCLVLLSLSSVWAETKSFSDVPSEHWAYDAVTFLSDFDVVNGYPDGTFQPSKEITRAEFSKIIVSVLEQKNKLPVDSTVYFMDVSKLHWAYDYIVKASVFLKSNHVNRFFPDNPVSREEIAMAMVRVLELESKPFSGEVLDQFSDRNNIDEDMKSYVAIAVQQGIMRGNANGTFTPKANVTRAELVQILYNSQNFAKLKLEKQVKEVEEETKKNEPKQEIPTGKNISLTVELNEKELRDGGRYSLSSDHEIFAIINNPSTTKNFIYYMFTYGNLETSPVKKIASSTAVITVPEEITSTNVELSIWGVSIKGSNTYVTATNIFGFNYTGKPAEDFNDWDYETDQNGRVKSNKIEFFVVFNGSTLDNNEMIENVKYNSKIIMRGRPVNNMKSINYKWDSDRNFTKTNEQTVTIDIPSSFAPGSQHRLTVTATNKDGQTTGARTYYFVISPNAK